jgi:pyridoxamine 5'-phosphate oxidase
MRSMRGRTREMSALACASVKYRFRTRPAYPLFCERAITFHRGGGCGSCLPALPCDDMSDDPIERFRVTYDRARASESFDASRAAFATADASGAPSVRFVLVKRFDARGFCVFTHLASRKGRELAENPRAALAFHWASLGEQVRIEGAVERLSEAESDDYFASRPRGSQIGAWASEQSAEIGDRSELEARVLELEARFGPGSVTRPPFWGGVRIVPTTIEFWRDRADRLHDRELYTRAGRNWRVSRLSP